MNIIKRNKDLFTLLFIITIILFFIVIFSYSLAFFSKSEIVTGNITLGELDYDILIENLNITNLLPGDYVDISVSLQNYVEGKNNLVPFYFRFKILNGDSDYTSNLVKINNANNFIKDNNYFYYKYKLKFKDGAKLLNGIEISKDLTIELSKNLNIQILVDAVQSEYGAYKEVFYDAPSEWIEFIENN